MEILYLTRLIVELDTYFFQIINLISNELQIKMMIKLAIDLFQNGGLHNNFWR